MKRGGPIKRKKRLRAVNPERAAKAFERDFGHKAAWIRGTGCVVVGCEVHPVEAAHVKSRGAGGTSLELVGLCRDHHREQHDFGIRTFSSKYGLDLLVIAAKLHARWLEVAPTWAPVSDDEAA